MQSGKEWNARDKGILITLIGSCVDIHGNITVQVRTRDRRARKACLKEKVPADIVQQVFDLLEA